MADGGDAVGYLIGFGILSAIISFITILAIFRKKEWQGRLRFFSIVACGLGAAFPTMMFNLIRTSKNPRLPVAVRASVGLPSIAGVFAAVYCFLLFVLMQELRKPKGGVTLRGNPKMSRRTSFFYILLMDLAIIACLAASVALTGSQVPWNFGACNDASNHDSIFVRGLEAEMTREIKYRRSPSAIFDDRKSACNSAVGIQLISTVMAIHIALQSFMILPVIAFPTPIRLLFFIAIRTFRRPHLKLRDEELGPAPHSASCPGESEKKSQCWACDAVICTACKATRSNLTAPRTTHHITNCYAVCTVCYLTRWSAQPAALSEALNPTDLGKHHGGCAPAKMPSYVSVELCGPCSGKSIGDLSGVRERREEVVLQRLLARRIFCAKCEKPVPKEKRRWWICGTGDHECHWGGHEPRR